MTHGQPDLVADRARLVHRVREPGLRDVEADADHRLLEGVAVLGLVDHLRRRADHLDAVALEDALVGELEGDVQRGLAAERREERVGLLPLDDLLDDSGVIGSM